MLLVKSLKVFKKHYFSDGYFRYFCSILYLVTLFDMILRTDEHAYNPAVP